MSELLKRKWLYHTAPSWVREETYFITVCCRERGINQLCEGRVAIKLIEAARHYHENRRWYVSLWLLMPDHLHGLVACPRNESLAKVMAAWKRFSARDCGLVWQKGFFDRRLRKDESFEEKVMYIRMNPVRAGLVARPED